MPPITGLVEQREWAPTPLAFRPPIVLQDAVRQLRSCVAFGVPVVLVVVVAIAWAILGSSISGAVVANGVLVVESGSKKVQHPAGGIVDRVLVSEGEEVKLGQTLLTLDSTLLNARLEATRVSLVETRARFDRLTAERNGAGTVDFPSFSGSHVMRDPGVKAVLENERRQFALDQAIRESERTQIEQRVRQAELEVDSLRAHYDSTKQQSDLAFNSLRESRRLFAQRLITRDKLAEDERNFVALRGSGLALAASIAAGEGKTAETRLLSLRADQDFDNRMQQQIDEARRRLVELAEQNIVAADAARRTAILAPQDGVVSELVAMAPGSVIQPAEKIMQIVPDADALVGEFRLKTTDVDEISVGQTAEIHLSAFDRATTPVINGRIESLSADRIEDQRTGAEYYVARVTIPKPELDRLGKMKLRPGMPIDIYAKTGDRRILSYLIKPLTDQLDRSFR